MQRRLLYTQLLLVALIGYLDIYLGIGREYFWTIWWWDIQLHILGGLWLGVATAWLLLRMKKKPTLALCVSGALAVGVAWEIFEYMTGTGGSVFMSYPLDTAKDLLDDVIGGAIAGMLITRKWPV